MKKNSDKSCDLGVWILILIFGGVIMILMCIAAANYTTADDEIEITPEPTSIEFDFNADIDGVEYFKDHGPETYVFKTDKQDIEVTIYRNHVTIVDNTTGEYVSIDYDEIYLY